MSRLYPFAFLFLLLPFATQAQVTNNEEAGPSPDGNMPSLSAPEDDFEAPLATEEQMIQNAVEDPAADAEDLGLESPGSKAAISTGD